MPIPVCSGAIAMGHASLSSELRNVWSCPW
jgi:hypothetical protein